MTVHAASRHRPVHRTIDDAAAAILDGDGRAT
jgi:hypothetical protein